MLAESWQTVLLGPHPTIRSCATTVGESTATIHLLRPDPCGHTMLAVRPIAFETTRGDRLHPTTHCRLLTCSKAAAQTALDAVRSMEREFLRPQHRLSCQLGLRRESVLQVICFLSTNACRTICLYPVPATAMAVSRTSDAMLTQARTHAYTARQLIRAPGRQRTSRAGQQLVELSDTAGPVNQRERSL
jgi:hypothetical protein